MLCAENKPLLNLIYCGWVPKTAFEDVPKIQCAGSEKHYKIEFRTWPSCLIMSVSWFGYQGIEKVVHTLTMHHTFIFFSYTEEKLLDSFCYWLGTSHSGQSSHCHMQVLIHNNLA